MATSNDVAHLASLARISIDEATLPALAEEFNTILTYIGQLDELSLDTTGGSRTTDILNAFRTDGTPHPKGAYTEALVAQFPQHEGDALSVKQIISHE